MTSTQLSNSKSMKPNDKDKLLDSAHRTTKTNSMFDILDDDAEEDPEDDVPEDEHA